MRGRPTPLPWSRAFSPGAPTSPPTTRTETAPPTVVNTSPHSAPRYFPARAPACHASCLWPCPFGSSLRRLKPRCYGPKNRPSAKARAFNRLRERPQESRQASSSLMLNTLSPILRLRKTPSPPGFARFSSPPPAADNFDFRSPHQRPCGITRRRDNSRP